MKSNFLSILFLLILVIVTGCKKEEAETVDFREKYFGTWEMTVVNNSTHFTTDMNGNSVTNYYTGTTVYPEVMVYLDAETDDGLMIDMRPEVSGIPVLRVSLNENGEFEKKCNPSMSYAIVSGEIESGNTISFDMHEWGMCDSYSAGGYSDQIVTGVKN